MDVLGATVNQPAKGDLAIDLVVPCYNEAEALPETHRQLAHLMDTMIRANMISAQSLSLIHI